MTTTTLATRPAAITAADVAAMTQQDRAELLRLLLSLHEVAQPLPPADDWPPVGWPPAPAGRFRVVRTND